MKETNYMFSAYDDYVFKSYEYIQDEELYNLDEYILG